MNIELHKNYWGKDDRHYYVLDLPERAKGETQKVRVISTVRYPDSPSDILVNASFLVKEAKNA